MESEQEIEQEIEAKLRSWGATLHPPKPLALEDELPRRRKRMSAAAPAWRGAEPTAARETR